MTGVVEAIFLTNWGSAALRRVDRATAVTGAGLAGDRYLLRRGHWTGIDECQVTLIDAGGLDEIAATTGLRVADGEHRRNLVVRGVDLKSLAGQDFHVGEALLRYDRPRPPCRHVEALTQPGMTRALARGRGGICAVVTAGGTIQVGDPVVPA